MFNSTSIALRTEKFQKVFQVDKSLGLNKEGKFDSQDVDWTGFHLQQAPKPICNQRQGSREE